MKRNIGRFQAVPYQMGGEVEEPVMPPQAPSNSPMQKPKNPQIMGAPMADPGMKKGIMGQIAAPKERLTPQSYAGEMAAQKRMKKAPTQSPLGPITGGLKSMGQGMQPQNPAANQPSMGDKWMGEVWQKLTPEEIPGMQEEVARGVGYAEGGDVYTPMSVYNQTMRDLQSGGVAGYAHGGMVDKANELASHGRYGDTMLMHVNPIEVDMLEQAHPGSVTINPVTGQPEAFAFLAPLVAGIAAAAKGAAAVGSGIMAGLSTVGSAMGGGLSALGIGGAKAATPALSASIAGMGAPAAASTVSPFITGGLGSLGIGSGALAPGAGVLAGGAGGGVTAGTAAAGGFAPSVLGTAAAGKAGLGLPAATSLGSKLTGPGASMMLKGLGQATSRPQRQAMGSPPPPQRRRGPMQPPPMPGRAGIEQLRRPGRNLPGNRRIG
jgi:hypothetical protein